MVGVIAMVNYMVCQLTSTRLRQLPIKLIVAVDYLPLISNGDQVKIINRFVSDMEKALHIKHERISFEQAWKTAPPSDADGNTLYMKDVVNPPCSKLRG